MDHYSNAAQSLEDRFTERLWMNLMCECAKCGNICELNSIDALCDANPLEWANQALRIAMNSSWTYHENEILCPNCREQ